MTEEVSERSGPKPYIMAPMGDELLCHYFFGKSQEETKVAERDDDDFEVLDDDDDKGDSKAAADKDKAKISHAPHFGASQVIIVREQRVKDELPEFMKSMLCLTVYEAKGLEFDDVILFNFFAMGEIRSAQWKLLQHVSEMEDVRDMVPDWILNINEAERESLVAEAVSQALSEYQQG